MNELEGKLAQLQIEISNSNEKVCELKKQVNQLELDLERMQHERNSARKELAAVKELCNKLDIETDKLNAEVNEYSEIRREVSWCRYWLINYFDTDFFSSSNFSLSVTMKNFEANWQCLGQVTRELPTV